MAAPASFTAGKTGKDGQGIGRLFELIHGQLPDRDELLPVLESYWHPYPPVYLYAKTLFTAGSVARVLSRKPA